MFPFPPSTVRLSQTVLHALSASLAGPADSVLTTYPLTNLRSYAARCPAGAADSNAGPDAAEDAGSAGGTSEGDVLLVGHVLRRGTGGSYRCVSSRHLCAGRLEQWSLWDLH